MVIKRGKQKYNYLLGFIFMKYMKYVSILIQIFSKVKLDLEMCKAMLME